MEILNPNDHVYLDRNRIKVTETTLIPVLKQINTMMAASHRAKVLGYITAMDDNGSIAPSDYQALRQIYFKYEKTIKDAEIAGKLNSLKGLHRFRAGDELIVECLDRECKEFDKRIENLRTQISMSGSSDYEQKDRPVPEIISQSVSDMPETSDDKTS